MSTPQPEPLALSANDTSAIWTRRKSMVDLTWSARRQRGAMMMAIVGIATILRLRATVESPLVLGLEFGVQIGLAILVGFVFYASWLAPRLRRPVRASLGASVLVLFPWLAGYFNVERPMEFAMMGSLAWGSFSLAFFASTLRTLGMSVVASGFLTLFTTFTSDQSSAIVFAFVWGLLCLWWLVANHWECMDTQEATTIQKMAIQRTGPVLLGVLLFLLASLGIAGRVSVWRKLDLEIAPTSGGTGSQSGAARSGVGQGDALVAAESHAVTFGPVDSDIFLESPEPSLFDVYSETFGEPFKNKRWERAIGLTSSEAQDSHGSVKQSDAKQSSFQTRRTKAKHQHLKSEKVIPPLFYWIGSQGQHLAVERFEEFDGEEWKQSPKGLEAVAVSDQKVGSRMWFRSPLVPVRDQSPYQGSRSSALKCMRYRSPIVPAPFGLQMWHVDKVDQLDFFELSKVGRLQMPGRLHIPDDTVIHMISSELDLWRIEKLARYARTHTSGTARSDEERALRRMAVEWSVGEERSWERIQGVLKRLKEEFVFERMRGGEGDQEEVEEESLATFVANRRGSDVMFATAASIMLDELGFATRLVTGFYANPERFDILTGQSAILAEDVHTWLEMEVGLGYWVPVEATPGYWEPAYRLSLWHRAKIAAPYMAGLGVLSLGLGIGIWRTRAVWMEILLRGLVWFHPWWSDSVFSRWFMWVLELRGRMAGLARPRSQTPRQWLQGMVGGVELSSHDPLQHDLDLFLRDADRMWFGDAAELSASGRGALLRLWQQLTIRHIQSFGKQHA